MADSLLLSIQSQQGYSTNYTKGEISIYSKWRRSGIDNFKICSVFNPTGAYSHINCPHYGTHPFANIISPSLYKYTAIGTFDFVVDEYMDLYKQYLFSIMQNDIFRNEFQQNMNTFLNNAINSQNKRRR
eukprot:273655_1